MNFTFLILMFLAICHCVLLVLVQLTYLSTVEQGSHLPNAIRTLNTSRLYTTGICMLTDMCYVTGFRLINKVVLGYYIDLSFSIENAVRQ